MVIVWLPLGKLSLPVERFCYTFMYKLSPEHRFASFVASSVLFQISFLITQMSRLTYAHVDYSWWHNRASHLQRAQLNSKQSSVCWSQKKLITPMRFWIWYLIRRYGANPSVLGRQSLGVSFFRLPRSKSWLTLKVCFGHKKHRKERKIWRWLLEACSMQLTRIKN